MCKQSFFSNAIYKLFRGKAKFRSGSNVQGKIALEGVSWGSLVQGVIVHEGNYSGVINYPKGKSPKGNFLGGNFIGESCPRGGSSGGNIQR